MSNSINDLKEAEKESLHISEQETTALSVKKNVTGGLILIGIGALFLFGNITGTFLNNWWALFILIPAFSNLSEAYSNYRQNGRLTHRGRGSLMGGASLALIASAFLFNISWGLIWPLFFIIGGLSILTNR